MVPCSREIASTAAHRTITVPCLVILPRWTLVSDSRCLGVMPAHEHSAWGFGNRDKSPISATKIAAIVGPTPGEGLNHPVAAVVAQPPVYVAFEGGDLPVKVNDQAPQRLDLDVIGVGQLEAVEISATGRAP